ncbi:MAG: hypothetical protein K2N67_04515 [Mucispirillum sp.]|nr:hypothetical protein [Mucispirillum sp.]
MDNEYKVSGIDTEPQNNPYRRQTYVKPAKCRKETEKPALAEDSYRSGFRKRAFDFTEKDTVNIKRDLIRTAGELLSVSPNFLIGTVSFERALEMTG